MNDKKKANEQRGTVAVVKPKKKKVLLIVLAIVVVAAALIGGAMKNLTKTVETASNAVPIQPVEKRDLSDTIALKGAVAGRSRTNVTSKAISEITSMNVQVGDVVKEGDLLCTLDSASIKEKIAELEKTLSNSEAMNSINNQQTIDAVQQAKQDQVRQLEEAKTQITRAEESYNGTQLLYNRGEADFQTLLSAQRAVESARLNYDNVLETTNRAIKTAETSVELNKYKDSDSTARDTLTSLKKQLADCEIVAPCGGVVTAVNVRVGDINAEKVTILTIEDTSSLKMVATVQEADILKLEEGMSAVATADATGEAEIAAKVTRVVRVKGGDSGPSPSGGASGGATAPGGYSVELSIDNTELLVGMNVKAKVMIKEKDNVLAVPYDLVRHDDDGSAYVLVAEDNGDDTAKAVRKNIEVGEEVDYYTEITGGDLKEGDQLIYDYKNSVAEGQTFTPGKDGSNQATGALGEDSGAAESEVVK